MHIILDTPVERFAPALGQRALFVTAQDSVVRVRPLSVDELDGYDRAMKRLADTRQGDIILVASERNWEEFTDTVVTLDAHAEEPNTPDGESLALDVNRRFANYLGLMRLYLDYEERRVKRTYGPSSAETAAFKAICKSTYDASFGYRFAYRLRNYGLHYGLPVGHIATCQGLDPATDAAVSTLALCFDVGELLEAEKEIWRSLSAELRARGPLLNVAETVDDLAACVRSIRDSNRHWELPHLERAASQAVNALRDALGRGGTARVGHYSDDAGRLAVDLDPSPMTIISALGIQRLTLDFDPRELTRA